MSDADFYNRQVEQAAYRSLAAMRAEGRDLGVCDYFRGTGSCSASGGTCAVLCEPLCMTDRPAGGWPSETNS